MHKTLLMTGLSFLVAAPVYAADVSATLGVVSDYRYNGISQTKGHPAVQGSVEVSFENGIYSSIWASNVDFDDDAHTELDYYLGYNHTLNNQFSYDINLAHFSYPGYGSYGHIGQYDQLNTTLYYRNLSLTYGYAPDYFGTSDAGHYIGLAYSYPLTATINLDLHAGRSFGQYWREDDVGSYEDYAIGFSTDYAGMALSLKWLTNHIKHNMQTQRGGFRNDDTLLLAASYSW